MPAQGSLASLGWPGVLYSRARTTCGCLPSSQQLLSLSQDSSLAYPFADLFPLYEGAVAEFGVERVVFGTDFPHVRDRSDYAESVRWLQELPFLNESEQAVVGDRTARDLFGIPPIRQEER